MPRLNSPERGNILSLTTLSAPTLEASADTVGENNPEQALENPWRVLEQQFVGPLIHTLGNTQDMKRSPITAKPNSNLPTHLQNILHERQLSGQDQATPFLVHLIGPNVLASAFPVSFSDLNIDQALLVVPSAVHMDWLRSTYPDETNKPASKAMLATAYIGYLVAEVQAQYAAHCSEITSDFSHSDPILTTILAGISHPHAASRVLSHFTGQRTASISQLAHTHHQPISKSRFLSGQTSQSGLLGGLPAQPALFVPEISLQQPTNTSEQVQARARLIMNSTGLQVLPPGTRMATLLSQPLGSNARTISLPLSQHDLPELQKVLRLVGIGLNLNPQQIKTAYSAMQDESRPVTEVIGTIRTR